MSDTIRFYLSGGEQNQSAAAALGGPPSRTEVVDLFSDVYPDEAATGSIEARCVYVLVAEGGPVENPRVFFAQGPDRTVMEVGVDPAGRNGIAHMINPGDVPRNVIWSRPNDYLTGLDLPDEPYAEGDSVALWIRRIVPSGAIAGKESFNLRVRGLIATEGRKVA